MIHNLQRYAKRVPKGPGGVATRFERVAPRFARDAPPSGRGCI